MLTIDNDFCALIPPLTQEERAGLEESLLSEGCRDPLIVWNGVLVDGHNRHELCTKHNIHFEIKNIDLDSRQEALGWIIRNQLSRRNLTPYQRAELALSLESLYREKGKEKQRESGGAVPQISAKPPVDTRQELSKTAGVSHDTMAKVQKIDKLAPEEVKVKLRSGEVSINKAYQDIRREEKREEVTPPPPLPEGEFDVIYADPPWKYDHSKAHSRDIENQYPTMGLDEIKGLRVPAAENAVLLLWATAPKLLEAFEVMQAWGFSYRTNAVWDKEIIGMGYWFRGQHELLLVGVKGNFSPPAEGARVSSVIRERRGKHSAKPEKLYTMIESMFPNRCYCELFGRKSRKGWRVWGNQNE